MTLARWKRLSLAEQMANVGSEVYRAIRWENKHKLNYSQKAFYRSLELLSLTIDCYQGDGLRELTRVYEVWADYFAGENEFKSTDEKWNKYFYYFNLAARRGR